MHVREALQTRHTVRAFTAQPLDAAVVQQLMQDAARAPSAGNMQPWRAVALTGAPLQALLADASRTPEDTPRCPTYPDDLWDPYRSRRFAAGEAMYTLLDIPREDKAGRQRQQERNAQMFGAPVGIFLFIDDRMGFPQWMDMGIYLQSFMLLAAEAGLATCAQGFWRRKHTVIHRHIPMPEHYQIVAGIALGYEDTAARVNTLRTTRADFAQWGELRGFERPSS